MGPGPRCGCSSSRRPTSDPRSAGTLDSQHGAKRLRWRKLVHSLSHDADGGAAGDDVAGENNVNGDDREAFLAAGTCSLEYGGTIVHERVGGLVQPQARDHISEEVWWSEEGGGQREVSFSKEEGQIPKEASSSQGGRRSMRRTGLDECGTPEMEAHTKMQFASEHAQLPFLGPGNVCGQDGAKGGEATKASFTEFKLCYIRWCAMLCSEVLKSRTLFAAYLAKTLHLPRTAKGATPTLFPIPVPFPGIFGRVPQGISSAKRRVLHLRRALHVICMCLNFWHAGGSFNQMELLGRPPSSVHGSIYRRVIGFIKSDGLFDEFPFVKAGRRFPQLGARLSELSEWTTRTGVASTPYGRCFEGMEVEAQNDVMEELHPYRNLCVERLKLHGKGLWDPVPFLDDQLVMGYCEPASILVDRLPEKGEYPKITDKEEDVAELGRLWDQLGLLYLHRDTRVLDHPHEAVRVFNAYKAADRDRQIGDKRGRNACESKMLGPSAHLPCGSDLADLVVPLPSHRVWISTTDRKDFYHQLKVTAPKAETNTLLPMVAPKLLQETKAYAEYLERSSKKKYDRKIHGDMLGKFASLKVPEAHGMLFVAFNSVLQGDHAGVEVATSAHRNLLKIFGLLTEETEVTASRPFESSVVADGLVIDDYFCVAVGSAGEPAASTRAKENFDIWQAAYALHGLPGSPDKDLVAASSGKVIGAFINGSEEAVSRGLVTLASPVSKRLGLSWTCLQVSKLTYTSDALHSSLVGGLVSSFLYRRPLIGLLNSAFHLFDVRELQPEKPKLVPLTREVANELVMSAVLLPLAMVEMNAGFHEEIFATDASNSRGGIVAAGISPMMSEVIWRSCKSKGAYTRLQSTEKKIAEQLDLQNAEENNFEDWKEKVPKPLAFRFQFIEGFSGAGKVTSYVAELGFSVGPPLDLSNSLQYDLTLVHVMEWLSHLCKEGYLLGLMMEPPCTTFSIRRHPPLRDRDYPMGFNPRDPQTHDGNCCAQRGLQLLWISAMYYVAGLFETPFSSKMQYLPSWRAVSALKAASWCRADSCRFGSIHQKGFRLMGVHLDLRPLALTCTCTKKHIPVEGRYTKASATYTDQLASTMAEVLAAGMEKVRVLRRRLDEIDISGKESQIVNDVATSSDWRLVEAWNFKTTCHINILEMAVVERLLRRMARTGKSLSVISLVDSFVVRAAIAKREVLIYFSFQAPPEDRSLYAILWTLPGEPFCANTAQCCRWPVQVLWDSPSCSRTGTPTLEQEVPLCFGKIAYYEEMVFKLVQADP